MEDNVIAVNASGSAQHVSAYYQDLYTQHIVPLIEGAVKGVKVPKDVRVLLSFPTSGGESVEPPLDKDGAVNPRAGEAKKRFQYLQGGAVSEDGTVDAALMADPIFASTTKHGKVVNDGQPLLLVTPAKHAPWKGSAFGTGEGAEIKERVITLIHGGIFASIIENPPTDVLTKTGNVKVYNGHFEKIATQVGLMGKGWNPNPGLMKTIEGIVLANPAPDGAAVVLKAPEKKPSDITSITLRAADGTEFTISARTKASEKQSKGGKLCAADVLEHMGPFTFVKRKDKEGKEGGAA